MATSTSERGFRPASRLSEIRPSPIRAIFDKAAELEADGEKVYHFEIGRPDFDTPAPVKESAITALNRGDVHYGPNAGTLDLRSAIADYLAQRRLLHYEADGEVLVTIGANEAVFLAIMAFCGPGDEVIIPVPAWAHYRECVRLAGATPIPVELDAEDNYNLDVEAIAAHVTSATRMIVVCTPNNPSGTVVGEDELNMLSDVLKGTDALLLSDEIYADLIYGDAVHHSPAALPDLRDRTLSIGGFAKAFAMDGWRLGWLAGPRELITPALRVRQFTTVCPPTFLQPAAATALRSAREEAEGMRAEFERRRNVGLELLTGIPGVHVTRPDGAFYLYLTYDPAIAEPADELALRLLSEDNVAVIPGTAFDPEGGTYALRISYACHVDDLREGLTRITHALTPTTKQGETSR